MTSATFVGVHIQPHQVTAACARGGAVLAHASIPSPHSVSYDSSVVDAIGRVCATARVPVSRLSRVVVGASLQSLLPTRLLRHVPSGRHWRSSLAVALEFRLPVPVRVESALALAALAEARTGAAAGVDEFIVIRAGRPAEVGATRQERFESVGVVPAFRSDGDPYAQEHFLGELTRLIRPLCRPGRAPVVVLHGRATAIGRVVERRLPAKLVARGLRRPDLRATEVRGDAVVAGALLLATSAALLTS